MHLTRRFAVLLLLAAPMVSATPLAPPAIAAETDMARFPFATEAGTYRDLIVYPADSREMRLVFPLVTVERPAPDRALLRPGGDGRVIVETAAGADGRYETGAELYFGQAPVILSMKDDQLDMRLSMRALALPLIDSPDSMGRIAFDGMLATLSVPTNPSPALRKARFALKAAGTRIDAEVVAPDAGGAAPLATGAVDIAGALDLRMLSAPDGAEALLRSVTHARLDRGSVEMLDGRIAVTGSAAFSHERGQPVSDLRGTVAIDRFSTMTQRLMRAGILTPRQVLPLAVAAGSLGALSPDGTLTFDIETTPDSILTVNGKPLTLPDQ